MTLKNRLQKLEEKTIPPKQDKIYVHLEGNDYVMCEGKKIPLAEFEKMKEVEDMQVINVVYDKDKTT